MGKSDFRSLLHLLRFAYKAQTFLNEKGLAWDWDHISPRRPGTLFLVTVANGDLPIPCHVVMDRALAHLQAFLDILRGHHSFRPIPPADVAAQGGVQVDRGGHRGFRGAEGCDG